MKVKDLKVDVVRLKHFSLLCATMMEVMRTAVVVTLTTVAADPKQVTSLCTGTTVVKKTVAVDQNPDLTYGAMLLGTEIMVVLATKRKIVAANLTAVAVGPINMTSLCTRTAMMVDLAMEKTVAANQDLKTAKLLCSTKTTVIMAMRKIVAANLTAVAVGRISTTLLYIRTVDLAMKKTVAADLDLKMGKQLCTKSTVVMATRKMARANLTAVAVGLIKVIQYAITTGTDTMAMVARATENTKRATWLWTTAMAVLVMKVAVILREVTLLCTVMRVAAVLVSPSLALTVNNNVTDSPYFAARNLLLKSVPS